MEDIQMNVSTVAPDDIKVGEDKDREIEALNIYDDDIILRDRPQPTREYLTEMLVAKTVSWYYAKNRKDRLHDITCIVRVLEMLEE